MGFFDRGKGPTATPSRTGASGGGGSKGNKGEGNAKDGYPFGSTTPGYIDYRDPSVNGPFFPGTKRQLYQDDPNARKLHSPGSSRGEQMGYKPSVSPKPVPGDTSAYDDAWAERRDREEREAFARRGMPFASDQEWRDSDPEFVRLRDAARAATDPREKSIALRAALDYDTKRRSKFKDDNALKAFIAQGGTEETYRNRFKIDWPKPKSPLGAYSHGPGSADWDTRFTNPVPPNTIGGGRSGGGGNDAANTTSQRQSLPDWAKGGGNVGDGLANIAGYLGSGGMTEDLPPGASFDMPSNNILSALKPLSDNLWNGNKPTGSGTASPAKKPTVVRRGGGRTESR